MKKLFTCMAVLATMAVAGLTSCSKIQGLLGNSQVSSVNASYHYETTTDFLKYFDQTLEYYDLNSGEIQSLKLSSTTFSQDATPKLPLTVGMRLTTTLKNGITLDQIKSLDSFQYIAPSLDYGVFINYDNSNWAGEYTHVTNNLTPMSISGAKVVEYYNTGDFNKSFLKKFDTQGNPYDGQWD